MKKWVNFASVKSPCYDCNAWGTEEFPECAEGCPKLEEYKVYHGFPTIASEPIDPALYPDSSSGEKYNYFTKKTPYQPLVQELIEFIQREKERLGVTYVTLATRIGGVNGPRLADMARGRYKSIPADVAERIREYREAQMS